jgi:N utilization substance protein B
MAKKIGKRRRSRIYALQALYCQHITGYSLDKTLRYFWHNKRQESEIPEDYEDLINDKNLREDVMEFSEQLLVTTLNHLNKIDEIITQTASHWDFDRISTMDKNILRLAIGELLYVDNIPPKVTINEAIEIAKNFSSEKSGQFVNGVLDKVKTVYLEQK